MTLNLHLLSFCLLFPSTLQGQLLNVDGASEHGPVGREGGETGLQGTRAKALVLPKRDGERDQRELLRHTHHPPPNMPCSHGDLLAPSFPSVPGLQVSEG